MKARHRFSITGPAGIIIGVISLLVVIGIGVLIVDYNTSETKVCTITNKDRTTKYRDGQSESDMRVYTKDCGVFKVADAVLKGQFRSADLYNQIEIGHKYNLKFHGWRIGITSSFPNITEAIEVN